MNDPLTLEFIRRIKPNFKVTKKADKESLRELILTNRKMRVELKKYFNDRKYPTSISVAKPEEVMNMRFTIDGEIPIKPNEHIQTTENAIA